MTPTQSLLVRMMNMYNDDIFIEIIETFDDPDFWRNLDPIETLSDETCLELCGRLAQVFQTWNIA